MAVLLLQYSSCRVSNIKTEQEEALIFLKQIRSNTFTQVVDIFDDNGDLIQSQQNWHNKRIIDSLRKIGYNPQVKVVNDTLLVSDQYLENHVSKAFEIRDRYAWTKAYPLSIFKMYILPYKVSAENISDWRSFFFEKYKDQIEELKIKDVRTVATHIIDDVKQWLHYDPETTSYLQASFSLDQAIMYKKGDCNVIADILIMALRAVGVAATKDIIPLWGSTDFGHVEVTYFDECLNPILLSTGDLLKANTPKIYRQVFDYNQDLKYGSIYFSERNNCIDVTSEYIATTSIRIPLSNFKYDNVGVAVFNSGRWQAAAKSDSLINDSLCLFVDMGREIIYRPIEAQGLKLKSIDHPFVIEKSGAIRRLQVDNLNKIDICICVDQISEYNDSDEYCLLYWDFDQWKSLSLFSSLSTERICIRGVPSNTIYRIFNVTKKTYCGRIYAYEKNNELKEW